jgi:formylglycine-generating enzyme required for sulfatase activity
MLPAYPDFSLSGRGLEILLTSQYHLEVSLLEEKMIKSLLHASLLVLPVVLTVTCSGQDTGKVSRDLADKLTDAMDFDNGMVVKGEKPLEHRGDPAFPQVISIDAPSSLIAGQSFELVLYTDYANNADITGAVVAVRNRGVYAGSYIDVAAGVVLVDGKKRMKMSGVLNDALLFEEADFTVELGMHRSDGQVGNYFEWVLNVRGKGADAGADPGGDAGADGAVDSGFDAGVDAGFDAGADAGSDAGFDAGTDAGAFICQDFGGALGWQCSVPAGDFHMGCNNAVDLECDQNGYEDPYHVATPAAFKIDKYEVTVSQYAACNTASPSTCTAPGTSVNCNWGVAGRENHPINCTDWSQAKAYCVWAGKRLPTEAEWEKAARGTDGRKYPWGDAALDCSYAVYSLIPCPVTSTATVGSKPQGVSPYGAMDMVGNISEWVEDDWHDNYTGAPVNGSAWIDSPRATNRVLRGGSWESVVQSQLRCSFRGNFDPTGKYSHYGFRCAK